MDITLSTIKLCKNRRAGESLGVQPTLLVIDEIRRIHSLIFLFIISCQSANLTAKHPYKKAGFTKRRASPIGGAVSVFSF